MTKVLKRHMKLFVIIQNDLSHVYFSNDSEFVPHEDTYELFKGLDLNNNGNIEPIEIDDSLKGKKKSFIRIQH